MHTPRFPVMSFIPANICLYAITADERSPILVLHKSHKASSHWHVVHGAPKIEENRKPAKLSIKLWQESPGKHGLTEDTPVTYHGLGIILVKMHSARYIIMNEHIDQYRDLVEQCEDFLLLWEANLGDFPVFELQLLIHLLC